MCFFWVVSPSCFGLQPSTGRINVFARDLSIQFLFLLCLIEHHLLCYRVNVYEVSKGFYHSLVILIVVRFLTGICVYKLLMLFCTMVLTEFSFIFWTF